MADVISKKSIIYDITFETDDAKKDTAAFSKEVDDLKKRLVTAETQLDVARKGALEFGKQALSAAARLKQIKNELNNFKGTEARFQSLTLEAAKLQDQINKTNQRIQTLASSTRHIQALGQSFSGLLGIFSAVQGAQALFGRESESLQRTLVKLQGTMALLQGVQQTLALVTEQSTLKTVAAEAAQKAYAFAANIATKSTNALKFAMAGTIVGAIVLLITYWKDLKEAIVGASDAQDDYYSRQERKQAVKDYLDKLDDQTRKLLESERIEREAAAGGIADIRRRIKTLEDLGATEDELFLDKRMLARKELEELKIQEKSIMELRGLSDRERKDALNLLSIQIKDKEAEIQNLLVSGLEDVKKVVREIGDIILFDPDLFEKQEQALREGLDRIVKMIEDLNGGDELKIKPKVDMTELDPLGKELLAQKNEMATFGEVLNDSTEEIAQTFGALAQLAKQGSQAQMAFSIANILTANAEALAQAIKSAAGVPWPGNIPAILTSVATITAMFAQVKGLVAQSKAAQSQATFATAFAEGEVDIHRPGEKPGKDSIPAMIMPGESVLTAEKTRKHRALVEAIHAGTVDDLIRVNYVEPALVLKGLKQASDDSKQLDYSDKFYRQYLATGEGNVNSRRMVKILASIDRKLSGDKPKLRN